MDRKIICSNFRCQWKGKESEVLRAKNPFDSEDEITACPSCKDINSNVYACDEEGCWRESSCGTPTEHGYRSTCGEHCPK